MREHTYAREKYPLGVGVAVQTTQDLSTDHMRGGSCKKRRVAGTVGHISAGLADLGGAYEVSVMACVDAARYPLGVGVA